MLSIGEFSQVTKITIKALRLYHEKGLLIPDYIDYHSKYRYYSHESVKKANIIKQLKEMDFSLTEIKDILIRCSDDHQVIDFIKEKLDKIQASIKHYKNIKANLDLFLKATDEEQMDTFIDIKTEVIPDFFYQ